MAQLAPGAAYFAAANVAAFDVVQGTNFPVDLIGFSVGDKAFWGQLSTAGYVSGDLTFTILWYAAATTGNVKWQVSLAAYTPGTDTGSWEAKAFAAATAVQTTVSGNAKALNVTTITITGASLDGLAPGDVVEFLLERVAASASEMDGDALFTLARVLL